MSSVPARAENELLLLCARTKVGEESAERVKALAAGVLDWDYLFLLAQRHAVLPLLYRQLNANARELLPPDFQKKLSAKFRENATRNMLLTGELTRIVKLFEAEGISTLAYKGPALAAAAYGDISLRRFIDLDIIVRKRDVRRARDILYTLGFRLAGDMSRSQEEILLRTQHNMAFTRDEGKLIVEVHWEVASQQFASVPVVERVWERAVKVALNGGEVKTLSPEDLLIALCVHGTKHLWERIAWICDVAELVGSHKQLDWPYVLRHARDAHVERMLHLGLRLAGGLLTAPLPDDIRKQTFDDKAAAHLSSTVVARLFGGENYEPAGLLESVAFNLRARRRLREKLLYFRFIFKPTDGDLNALQLPPSLTFVYYLLRPFRLLRKGTAGH
ncbi:MAG TPA: nucleotidyltransferase family protein [Pyrinomonadaceae bacterium]|nr:nucleotidyltransferase family protein [Pyrinomonadaceae bacterium]